MKYKELKQLLENNVVSFDRFRLKAAQKQGKDIEPHQFTAPQMSDVEKGALFESEVDVQLKNIIGKLPAAFKNAAVSTDKFKALSYYYEDIRMMKPRDQHMAYTIRDIVDKDRQGFFDWATDSRRRLFQLHQMGQEQPQNMEKNSPLGRVNMALYDLDSFIAALSK